MAILEVNNLKKVYTTRFGGPTYSGPEKRILFRGRW